MLSPLIKRTAKPASRQTPERGVTMAIVALSMVAIISFAALAIDLGSLYEAKSEAQRSAEAAALAAAQVISVSGLTGDPSNTDGNWSSICGPTGVATVAAQGVANQNLIGGKAPSTITILYGPGGAAPSQSDCGSAGSTFGINPTVSVYVQQATLPTFFARVFGMIGGTSTNSGVSATAYAEAFNSSDSNAGIPTPVQPRCVKPMIIPNLDPRHPIGSGCSGTSCSPFVTTSTGAIFSPGMYTGSPQGVIGERLFLQADCTAGESSCLLDYQGLHNPPQVYTNPVTGYTTLLYVPGAASSVTPVALPTSGSTCADVLTSWAQDVAGCDQSTVYQCGVPVGNNSNYVNLSENPATSDTQNALQCLINQGVANTSTASGQDTLGSYTQGTGTPPAYPFQILAGTSNPLVANGTLASGSQITTSSSIMTLPIYDQTGLPLSPGATTNVTIIGFLQVFVNATDTTNGVDATVLNVTGCGNTASPTAPAAQGTSPVPVRLITPP